MFFLTAFSIASLNQTCQLLLHNEKSGSGFEKIVFLDHSSTLQRQNRGMANVQNKLIYIPLWSSYEDDNEAVFDQYSQSGILKMSKWAWRVLVEMWHERGL